MDNRSSTSVDASKILVEELVLEWFKLDLNLVRFISPTIGLFLDSQRGEHPTKKVLPKDASQVFWNLTKYSRHPLRSWTYTFSFKMEVFVKIRVSDVHSRNKRRVS